MFLIVHQIIILYVRYITIKRDCELFKVCAKFKFPKVKQAPLCYCNEKEKFAKLSAFFYPTDHLNKLCQAGKIDNQDN